MLRGFLLAAPSPAGNNNPDSITEATEIIISKDYTTEVGSDVVEDPNIVLMEWDSTYGYNGPGWRARPTPVNGTAEAEDIAGWSFPFGGVFGVDEYELIVISFMLKISAALLDEMSGPSGFMAHPLKFLDVKAYNAAGSGEGARNCFHFMDYGSGPQFAHSGGGGGSNSQTAFGPDWRTLADEWVWCAMVWDMRGATAAERYMAMYTKRAGDSGVTRIGRRFENQTIGSAPDMEPYDGRGFLGFFSPLAGYWDDIHDAENLVENPADYALHLDRVRIANGWPTGSDGPPF